MEGCSLCVGGKSEPKASQKPQLKLHLLHVCDPFQRVKSDLACLFGFKVLFKHTTVFKCRWQTRLTVNYTVVYNVTNAVSL